MKREQPRVRAIRCQQSSDCGFARVKGKVTTIALLLVLSVLVVSPRSVESNQYRSGTIEGTVTDFAGLPVPNATVYVLQNGRTPASVSDTKGNFVLTNVAIGKQRVFAYKESDNYPNPVWSFYGDAHSQEGFPLVTVRENGPSRNVIVRLGPKSARLLMTVSDARTKEPVSGAAVLLNHEGKPKTLFNPGAVGPSGELTVLIPVGVPVKLKVTAEGYQTWNYRDRNSKPPDAIQLKTGESKSMKIELTKVYTAPAQ